MSTADELAEGLDRTWSINGTTGDFLASAAAELRRLSEIERQYLALKASIGEPVAWQKKRLLRDDDKWTPVATSNLQPYKDSHDFVTRPLYAIKDNQP